VVLHSEGDLEKAREHYRRALAIFERHLPEDHPNIKGAQKYLAAVEEEMTHK
jgi:hypothetical protein